MRETINEERNTYNIDFIRETGYTKYAVQPGKWRGPVPEIRHSRGDVLTESFD
jgi:hypothetical protein